MVDHGSVRVEDAERHIATLVLMKTSTLPVIQLAAPIAFVR